MRALSILLLFIALGAAKAQEVGPPLQAIRFDYAYQDEPMIEKIYAQSLHIPGKEQLAYLDDTTKSIGRKIAVLNAMGMGDSTRFDVLRKHIANKYNISLATIDSILVFRGPQPAVYPGTEKITASDLCCMAYFKAITAEKKPLAAYYCAYIAVDKKPGSMAASYVYGLILAQIYFELDYCRMYEVMTDIKKFDGYTSDSLRTNAIEYIVAYIEPFKKSCKNTFEDLYKKPASRQLFDKKKFVELSVVEIEEPEYDSQIAGSVIRVQIMNTGTVESIETNASLADADLTIAQAKKLGLKDDALIAIKDNNENANPNDHLFGSSPYMKAGIDYDKDFEIFQRVPPIKPGEIVTITFTLEGHWVYDVNCEIQVNIDKDNNIEEKDKKNNVQYFVKTG